MSDMWKVVAITVASGFLACCHSAPTLRGEHPSELVGNWHLVMGHDCSAYGIKSDVLVLRADGMLEQHAKSEDGKQFDSNDQRWTYISPSSIALNARRDFFTKQKYSELVGIAENEVLILEPGNSFRILLNPDSDCVYEKER